jgi:hypothetical protein
MTAFINFILRQILIKSFSKEYLMIEMKSTYRMYSDCQKVKRPFEKSRLGSDDGIQIIGSEVLTAVIMKNYIFWDITMYSDESQTTFQRNISPPSSRSKKKPSRKPA